MIIHKTYLREVINRSLIGLAFGGFALLNAGITTAQDDPNVELRFAQPGTYLENRGGGVFSSSTTSIEGASLKCGEIVSVFLKTPPLPLNSDETAPVARDVELHLAFTLDTSRMARVGGTLTLHRSPHLIIGARETPIQLNPQSDDRHLSLSVPHPLAPGEDMPPQLIRFDFAVECTPNSTPIGALQFIGQDASLSWAEEGSDHTIDLHFSDPIELLKFENITGAKTPHLKMGLSIAEFNDLCNSNVFSDDESPSTYFSQNGEVQFCYRIQNVGTQDLEALALIHNETPISLSEDETRTLLAGETLFITAQSSFRSPQWSHAVVEGLFNRRRFFSDVRGFIELGDNDEADFDQDGLSDRDEAHLGTNIAVADTDGDGLSDGDEVNHYNLDPLDADNDDDGVVDGDEWPEEIQSIEDRLLHFDADGDGLPNPLDPDSDNDGLLDGVEKGLIRPHSDTIRTHGFFQADRDPSTTTDPFNPNSDGQLCHDGVEDVNLNGKIDEGESDPNQEADDVDEDGDGICSVQESYYGLDPRDIDSDDDGVADGEEGPLLLDVDGDGLISALDKDSDGDGLFDGLELGKTTPLVDTDVERGHFVADLDPSTTTDPQSADTDRGGALDGVEDRNQNGRVDEFELDPLFLRDDQLDADQDGVSLGEDNCPLVFNPEQLDDDQDGKGDLCDADASRDAIVQRLRPVSNQSCIQNPISSKSPPLFILFMWVCFTLMVLGRRVRVR